MPVRDFEGSMLNYMQIIGEELKKIRLDLDKIANKK